MVLSEQISVAHHLLNPNNVVLIQVVGQLHLVHAVRRPSRLVVQHQLLGLIDPLGEVRHLQVRTRGRGPAPMEDLEASFQGLYEKEVLDLCVQKTIDMRTISQHLLDLPASAPS